MTLPTSSNTLRPRGRGFGAQLDDLLLRLAPGQGRELMVESAESQAQQVSTSELPEEFTSAVGRTFARSDLSGGEGLFRAHRRDRDESDPTRYWDSRGVKITRGEGGTAPEVCLLEAMSNLDGSTTYRTTSHMATVGGSVFVANSTSNVRVSADPTATTPTWANEDPRLGGGGTLGNLATLGDELFAAIGSNGVHKRTSAGVWSHLNDLAAVLVWAVKGRLLASTGSPLYEVADFTATTAPASALRTLKSNATWVAVVDGGEAILAAASDGYVYAFAADETGVLVQVGETFFQGETPTALGASQGKIAVGTVSGSVARLWVMDLSDGHLSGEVVRQWTTAYPPRVIVADRESMYTVIGDASGVEDWWRYDVSTGGMYRWWSGGNDGDAYGACLLAGYAFHVADGDLWRTSATVKESSGWLMTPLADFYSADAKSWVEVSVELGDVPAGASVDLYVTSDPDALSDEDSTGWIRVATASVSGVTSAPLTDVSARELALMVRLTASTAGTGCPEVRAVTGRALLAAVDVVVDLPVNVSDVVERPYKSPLRIRDRGAEVYEALKAKDGQPVLLRTWRPPELIRGQVEKVSTPVPMLSRRGSSLLVSMVRVRGRRVSESQVAVGEGMLGGAVLGGIGLGAG